MSEEAATAVENRKRKRVTGTSTERGEQLLKSPPRDPQAEIEAEDGASKDKGRVSEGDGEKENRGKN